MKRNNPRKQASGYVSLVAVFTMSMFMPGTGQFSNPLFANLDEFKALKESLQREGIFDESGGIFSNEK